MPHTREFLEELVAEAKKHVPSWLYASLLKEARARSGGRARHRAPELGVVEKVALSAINEGSLKDMKATDLEVLWESMQKWYTSAKRRKESVETIINTAISVKAKLEEHKIDIKDTPLVRAIEELNAGLKPDVPSAGPVNAPVAFVGANVEPIEKARGEQFVGDTGICFIEKYLKPLGLTKQDVYLSTLLPKTDTVQDPERWKTEQIQKLRDAEPLVIVALSQTVGRELGDLADFVLPHPASIVHHDSGEVARKIKKVKSTIEEKKNPLFIRITKADDIKHIVYGVVMDPYGMNGPEEDAHNDWNPPVSVEAAAHNFAKGGMIVGLQHQKKAQAKVVETWVEQYPTRQDYLAAMKNKPHSIYAREFGDEIIHSGSWLMGSELGPVEWALYQKGEVTGFSPSGLGIRTPLKKADMPKVKIIELVKQVRK